MVPDLNLAWRGRIMGLIFERSMQVTAALAGVGIMISVSTGYSAVTMALGFLVVIAVLLTYLFPYRGDVSQRDSRYPPLR